MASSTVSHRALYRLRCLFQDNLNFLQPFRYAFHVATERNIWRFVCRFIIYIHGWLQWLQLNSYYFLGLSQRWNLRWTSQQYLNFSDVLSLRQRGDFLSFFLSLAGSPLRGWSIIFCTIQNGSCIMGRLDCQKLQIRIS